jgi:hypothetical protein
MRRGYWAMRCSHCTNFPFFRLARDAGVAYRKVLHLAEVIESGAMPSGLTASAPLVKLIEEAVMSEKARRMAAAR